MALFGLLVKSVSLLWTISYLVNLVESRTANYYGQPCSCPEPQPCPPCPEEPCPCPQLPPCSCRPEEEFLPLPTRKPVKKPPVTRIPKPPRPPPTPITEVTEERPKTETTPKPTNPTITKKPESCEGLTYTKIGCFYKKQIRKKRIFVNVTETKIKGKPKNMTSYIVNVLCDCAKRALDSRGKGYFAIAFRYQIQIKGKKGKKKRYIIKKTIGECWTGVNTFAFLKPWSTFSKSTRCLNMMGKECRYTKSCIGEGGKGRKGRKRPSLMLYQAQKEDKHKKRKAKVKHGPQRCDIQFKNVGCFDDDMQKPRPLDTLLSVDNDNSGQKIEWGDWNTYLPGLVCRCAELASDIKKDYFGIQDFGQCWGGGPSYNRSRKSESCVTSNYNRCNASEYINPKQLCVGKNHTNYVYKITDNNEEEEEESDTGTKDIKNDFDNGDDDGDDDDDEDEDSDDQSDSATNNNGDNGTTNDEDDTDDDDDDEDDDDEKQDDDDNKEEAKEPDEGDTDDYDDKPVPAISSSPSCELSYENVGCYGDKYASTRPLPIMMMRDDMEEPYKRTLNTPSLACRCARMARNRGFTHFGLKHNGECWSGPQAAYSYHKDGRSANCIITTQCVGQRNANCVYKIA